MLRRQLCVLACAWILWQQALGMVGGGRGNLFTWEPQEAFDTKATCDKARAAASTATTQAPATKKPKTICLPDTINPK